MPAAPVICLWTRSVFWRMRDLPWTNWLLRWSELFLFQVDMPKHHPEEAVIGRFEHPGQDEGQPENEQGPLQEQTGKDGAGC